MLDLPGRRGQHAFRYVPLYDQFRVPPLSAAAGPMDNIDVRLVEVGSMNWNRFPADLLVAASLWMTGPADAQSQRTLPPPPDALDYPTAVRCASLSGLLAARYGSYQYEWTKGAAERFESWAAARAKQSGASPSSAPNDIRDEKARFIASSGIGILPSTQVQAELHRTRGGDMKLCRSLLIPANARPEYQAVPPHAEIDYTAQRWVAGDKIDEFAFLIAAFGMTMTGEDGRTGTSVILWAHEQGALTPTFEAHLIAGLSAALSIERLKDELRTKSFGAAIPSAVRSPDHLPLANDIRDVAFATHDLATADILALLKGINTSEDIRRAAALWRR